MRSFAQSIVESVRHPLVLLDGQMRMQFANPAFYTTFGISEAQTTGHFVFDLDEGHWNIPKLRTLLEAVGPDVSFKDFEVRHSFPRLGLRVLLLNARQVHQDEDGKVMILLAVEDVTDKVETQDALLKLNRDLEDRVSERTGELETANTELEAFCYSVSHDLRAPLRALDGFSDELLRSYADKLDDKGRHYLKRLRAGTQRMGELIDDLLQLSRHSRGEMTREQVNLTDVAHLVADELQQRDPGRQVSFHIEKDLSGEGDPGLLKVVLENLLGNAWKFTGKKPSATITMGKTRGQGRPVFFVRDDGVGFDMSHASKLFGAFQRLHRQSEFPGNGIGLATVQRIIHRHGGQVWAESPPNQGATFYFTLPA